MRKRGGRIEKRGRKGVAGKLTGIFLLFFFVPTSSPDNSKGVYPTFAVLEDWALTASLSFSIVSWRTCSLSCPISSACSLMVSSNSLRNGLSFCAFCTGIGLGVALPLVKTVVMVCSPSSGSPSFGATIVRSLRILIKSPTGWFSVPKSRPPCRPVSPPCRQRTCCCPRHPMDSR